MIVVSDTSPITILYYSECLDILQKFFGTVYLPPAVEQELSINSQDHKLRQVIKQASFLEARALTRPMRELKHRLDLGEIEAISLALKMTADLLILDDKRAQKEAALISIPYVSSFALLVSSHQKGLVADLDQTLHKLEQRQIFLSKELKDFLHLV